MLKELVLLPFLLLKYLGVLLLAVLLAPITVIGLIITVFGSMEFKK